jgi:hypothetical protein
MHDKEGPMTDQIRDGAFLQREPSSVLFVQDDTPTVKQLLADVAELKDRLASLEAALVTCAAPYPTLDAAIIVSGSIPGSRLGGK